MLGSVLAYTPTTDTHIHTELISFFLPGIRPQFANVSILHFLLEDDVPLSPCRPRSIRWHPSHNWFSGPTMNLGLVPWHLLAV